MKELPLVILLLMTEPEYTQMRMQMREKTVFSCIVWLCC